MPVGGNYVLDKGFLATGGTAYTLGLIVKVQAGSGSLAAAGNAVAQATAATTNATAPQQLAVAMEDLDTVRLGTGKAVINCRLMGIARVQAGAAVAIGDHVTNDGTARAVTVTKAAAGAVPTQILGVALSSAGAAGTHIDVLLTPGVSY